MLAETLPLPQRLALTYAPRHMRAPTLALLALEQRLAAILRSGGEPSLAQIKLAWWRERLGEGPARWPEGEPLLALLRDFPGGTAQLGPMVDGWEMLLADRLDTAAIGEFAAGRAQGWAALGGEGALAAASQYALADLFLHLPPGEEAGAVRGLIDAEPWLRGGLDPHVRPLSVLHGLAGRALRRGAAELLDGPGALLVAMRLGMIGK